MAATAKRAVDNKANESIDDRELKRKLGFDSLMYLVHYYMPVLFYMHAAG